MLNRELVYRRLHATFSWRSSEGSSLFNYCFEKKLKQLG